MHSTQKKLLSIPFKSQINLYFDLDCNTCDRKGGVSEPEVRKVKRTE